MKIILLLHRKVEIFIARLLSFAAIPALILARLVIRLQCLGALSEWVAKKLIAASIGILRASCFVAREEEPDELPRSPF